MIRSIPQQAVVSSATFSSVSKLSATATENAEQLIDFASMSNNQQAQQGVDTEEGNQLGGLVDVLKGLINTLQTLISNILGGTTTKNAYNILNDANHDNKIGENATKGQVGDIVDVNVKGAGKLEGAEVLDEAGVRDYFAEFGYNDIPRSHKGARDYMINLDKCSNFYRVENDLYCVNDEGEIAYKASIGRENQRIHDIYVYEYVKLDDGDYAAVQQHQMIDTQTGMRGAYGGLWKNPFVYDENGKFVRFYSK